MVSMNFSDFQKRVRKILETELPDGRLIRDEGSILARDIKIGRTAFMEKMGVTSEAEYKRQCIKDRRIMYHCHIGMNTWDETARALKRLYQVAEYNGFVQDRAGICLDRRMGLPESHRFNVPAETGPTLDSMQDWLDVGQAAPIQPHMGDFMIGFPAATENTTRALQAGVTTIGNLSQYFSHEVPMWKDGVRTAVETAKAISIMGVFRDQGALMHSYLDDGLGALFFDCATVAGWAYLERYIVEELLGAKLSHCMGGLISDPVKRSGWVFALDEIHDHDCIGSMFFGDTISFTKNFDTNRGLVAEYMLWDIMTQMECPTGHALLSIPVTEAVRIPSLEEIVEAQFFARRLEDVARRLLPHFDFSGAKAFASQVVRGGREVYRKAMEGLNEAGVDTQDPVQMLYVLKRIGPAVFEEMFGVGDEETSLPRGRVPQVANDVFEKSRECIELNRSLFADPEAQETFGGLKVLLASTDVHEHALFVIENLLRTTGAEVINLGPEKNPDEVAEGVLVNRVQVVLVSTHNGMALEYAKVLLAEMEERDVQVPIIFGGVLNQKVDEEIMPVDVDEDLVRLGIIPARTLEDLVNAGSSLCSGPAGKDR